VNPIADFAIDKAMRLIARILTGKRLRTVATGLENLPAQGSTLIVARHYHHLFDGLALFAAIKRRFHIVVTLDWATNRRTRFAMELLNRLARWPMVLRREAFVSDSKNPHRLFSSTEMRRYQLRAVRQSAELLAANRIVVMFPEGYPNIDPTYSPKVEPDEFLPFKSGFITVVAAAERALDRKIPIVPVGIHYEVGAAWVAQLAFGRPVYRANFKSRQSLVEFVEQEVKHLSAVATARRE
jgi:putative membrane protein